MLHEVRKLRRDSTSSGKSRNYIRLPARIRIELDFTPHKHIYDGLIGGTVIVYSPATTVALCAEKGCGKE